ncbi:unnamed protein product [Somion occarium]|uniref:Ankyrin repeat protein n=1 Tax=Somion occarium TaxID=3059160 RepID=A0ABP1DJN8_9APHY
MPAVSRGHRAEAKYNVVLDYPQLGLHSAAASGNIALVRYALDHGQPINSALDGVLPLHAACSGGNDIVVRLLIDRGADVNAPRLPRRYSNDKGRDASMPIVGTSGSTPLHFACANGHMSVIMTLLLHGAHPDRADKHGTTPEMLARQNGWVSCADILKEWSHNKDRDLRERELSSHPLSDNEETSSPKQKESHAYCGSLDCRECATRKRIRVKRSIDSAIHMLKPTITQCHPPSSSTDQQPPSPLAKQLGEYTYYPTPDSNASQEFPGRRPSLPHVYDSPEDSTASRRRPSNSQSIVSSSSRRPRSADMDAEPSPSPGAQRIKGKISLLNIFKKNSGEASGTPDSLSSSSSVFTSISPSPAPDVHAAQADYTPLNASRMRNRLLSESGRQSPAQAVELHHAFSKESLQAQYNASTTAVSGINTSTQGSRSPSVRPGILRGVHGRSSSSGPSQPSSHVDSTKSLNNLPAVSGQSIRSLRFDSSSATSTSYSRRPSEKLERRHDSQSPARRVRGSDSKTSLRSHSPASPRGLQRDDEQLPPTSLPVAFSSDTSPQRAGDIEEEVEEDEEYGTPIEPLVGMSELTLGDRPIHASPEMTSSDLPPATEGALPRVFECPFSINCPPIGDEEPQDSRDRHASPNLLGIDGIDGRTRGDSLSSMNTNPTSSSSASAYLGTPAMSTSNLPIPAIYSPTSQASDLPVERAGSRMGELIDPSPKRSRIPLDIDIRSISSHAQAEALVQQAQQRIFDLQNEAQDWNVPRVSLGEGRTPLSARLAAYGESLAIERKFKEEEEKSRSPLRTVHSINTSASGSEGSSGVLSSSTLKVSRSARGLDRAFSLEDKTRVHGRHGRVQKVKRPHTSGGTPVSGPSDSSMLLERPGHFHSISSSAAIGSTPDISSKPPQPFVVAITPPPSSSYPATPPDRYSLDYRPRMTRSRTPDPESDSSYVLTGVPLSRFPTSPDNDTLFDALPSERTLTKQEREVARANKLAKMGFSSGGDSWQGAGSFSRSQKPRFGGIKTLVQTLTGKS